MLKQYKRFVYAMLGGGLCMFASCNGMKEPAAQSDSLPAIFPDYTDVTIPQNMAPLNFMMEDVDHVQARFLVGGQEKLAVVGDDGVVDIPENEWHQLMSETAGKSVQVEVAAWDEKHPEGLRYKAFDVKVEKDTIDPWIAYRLIEPGYESWRQMGIYERSLSSFEEIEVVSNKTTKSACVNCHHFANRSAKKMMFHARGANGGTVFLDNGNLKKVNPKEMGPLKNAVYPAWHPGGRFVAFSSNDTHQVFFAQGKQPLEVFDTSSDLIIYDNEKENVGGDTRFMNKESLETFPAWSPDGKWLYFCSSPATEDTIAVYKSLHYSILRVPFDSNTGYLGTQVDTVWNARTEGGSASYPRISPDGRFLLFTWANYGTFPVWHPEADLRMIDLATGKPVNVNAINAKDQADSYHSWSANGRWVMFGSRRLDGRYTRVFIAHVDKNGKVGKPFLLPQKDPRLNTLRLKSFNIPEFVDGRIDMPSSAVDLFKCEDKTIDVRNNAQN